MANRGLLGRNCSGQSKWWQGREIRVSCDDLAQEQVNHRNKEGVPDVFERAFKHT